MNNEQSIPSALLTLIGKLRAHPADSSVGQILRSGMPGGLDDFAGACLREQAQPSG